MPDAGSLVPPVFVKLLSSVASHRHALSPSLYGMWFVAILLISHSLLPQIIFLCGDNIYSGDLGFRALLVRRALSGKPKRPSR